MISFSQGSQRILVVASAGRDVGLRVVVKLVA